MEQVIDTPQPGEVKVDVKRDMAGFSGKPEDFAKDIALIQQQTMPPATPAPSPEPAPAQPEGQPQAAATPTAVPEPSELPMAQPQVPQVPQKFQTPEGQLDAEKLRKSTAAAQEALERYRAIEAELRKKQAEVNRARQGIPTEPAQSAQPQVPATFEAQIEEDIKAHGTGHVLARLFHAATEAGYNRARGEIEGVLQESELAKRERELKSIGELDPWVLSGEGYEALARIRQERPWVNASPLPWTEAYKVHLGDQEMKRRLGASVPTPTPKPVTAPPTPVTAAPPAPRQQPMVNLNDPDAISRATKGMTPEQEDAFWVSHGLPPIHKKRR